MFLSGSYAATVCPDCAGYVCGEGEVCIMDGANPTCELKMTGCDNNNRLVHFEIKLKVKLTYC